MSAAAAASSRPASLNQRITRQRTRSARPPSDRTADRAGPRSRTKIRGRGRRADRSTARRRGARRRPCRSSGRVLGYDLRMADADLYDYELPPELIAQQALDRRATSAAVRKHRVISTGIKPCLHGSAAPRPRRRRVFTSLRTCSRPSRPGASTGRASRCTSGLTRSGRSPAGTLSACDQAHQDMSPSRVSRKIGS